jgi:hypothetical protein
LLITKKQLQLLYILILHLIILPNETASKVQIFYHGTIGKSFDTNQSAGSEFSVSDLNQGLYIVKRLMKIMK